MKMYFLSLLAGLLVGIVYSLLGVRSPAPPIVALIGLLGILAGEQIVPLIKQAAGGGVIEFVRPDCREHMLGQLPGDKMDG